ncbi:MAG: reverse transcriptase-like protein [Polyangiaceae bacterium]|nr:reverse transcriptase-like protein [Polyangiaceae bacterium]
MPEWVHTLIADASHFHPLGLTGIGIVVQQRGNRGRGPIIDRISELHRDVPAKDVEAFAIRRAMEIALERGYTRVNVRSDHNPLRTRLRKRHKSQAGSTDPIHIQILELAKRFTWCDFGYMARRKNQLARRLARAAWEPEWRRLNPPDDDERPRSKARRSSPDPFEVFLEKVMLDAGPVVWEAHLLFDPAPWLNAESWIPDADESREEHVDFLPELYLPLEDSEEESSEPPYFPDPREPPEHSD